MPGTRRKSKCPRNGNGKRVILFLERCHWESTLFVNGKEAGSQNSLATPHEYDITDFIITGKNRISIRIDNRVIIPVGVNSHSISDHTQSNWNGITGDIILRTRPQVFIEDVRVFPDIKAKSAKIIVTYQESGTGTPILKESGYPGSKFQFRNLRSKSFRK